MNEPSTAPIRAEGLTKRYKRTLALNNVSFSLPNGRIMGLLGRNGAGKTTTLRLLAGLLAPTDGEAFLFGQSTYRLKPEHRAKLGYVSEGMKLPEWMSVGELMSYLRPLYPTWDRQLEEKLIKLMALPPRGKIKDFSRGMKMKAAFLAALSFRPKVLLLDEPFSGLDSQAREDVIDALLELAVEADWAVLLSSHDMDEVERLVDEVGWIEQGTLRLHESVESLESRCREISFHLNESNEAGPWPATWLHVRHSGRLVTAVDSAFSSEEASRRQIVTLCPEAQATEIRPIGLRHIYLALLRSSEANSPAS